MTEFTHPAEQGSTGKTYLNGHSSYPMYQYSVFLNGGRNEQLVVRAGSFETLLAGRRNVSRILQEVNINASASETGSQEACGHVIQKSLVVRKAGPNHGRQFKACRDCGEFLGFI